MMNDETILMAVLSRHFEMTMNGMEMAIEGLQGVIKVLTSPKKKKKPCPYDFQEEEEEIDNDDHCGYKKKKKKKKFEYQLPSTFKKEMPSSLKTDNKKKYRLLESSEEEEEKIQEKIDYFGNIVVENESTSRATGTAVTNSDLIKVENDDHGFHSQKKKSETATLSPLATNTPPETSFEAVYTFEKSSKFPNFYKSHLIMGSKHHEISHFFPNKRMAKEAVAAVALDSTQFEEYPNHQPSILPTGSSNEES